MVAQTRRAEAESASEVPWEAVFVERAEEESAEKVGLAVWAEMLELEQVWRSSQFPTLPLPAVVACPLQLVRLLQSLLRRS